MRRVVALGASNLTLGLASLLETARREWGPDVDVFAAFGYGRSYGIPSFFAGRTLPGILQSGLWRDLSAASPARTQALVTDVGNDVLFDVAPGTILEWVDEALARLRQSTDDITLTSLPLPSMEKISNAKFLFFRTLFYPPCRLSRDTVFERAALVNDGLARLAEAHGARFVRLDPSWYAIDPIHIRPARRKHAWSEVLLGAPASPSGRAYSRAEWARVQMSRAERDRMFGVARERPQAEGTTLRRGGRLHVY